MFLDANKNPVKNIFISKTTQVKTLKANTTKNIKSHNHTETIGRFDHMKI